MKTMWGETSLWLWVCISLMTSGAEHFLCSCWPFVCLLWKMFSCSAHFKIGLSGFLSVFLTLTVCFLYILWILVLYQVYDLKIFSLTTNKKNKRKEKKRKENIFSHSVGFWWFPLLVRRVLFFSVSLAYFCLCFWCYIQNNHCQDWCQGAFLLYIHMYIFFPPEFHGFGSYIQIFNPFLNWSFCMIWDRVTLLHVAVQFSQHHLLEGLCFTIVYSWLILSYFNWPHMHMCISGLSILFSCLFLLLQLGK